MINTKKRWTFIGNAGALALILLTAWSSFSFIGLSPVSASTHSVQATADGPAVVSMTSTTAQKSAPVEAIQEIDLRTGGGSYPGCIDELDAPVVDYKIDDLDLTGITVIATCGWQADETVKVTLMDPSGKFFTSEAKAVPAKNHKDVYQVTVAFQPGVDAPEGKYRFTLQGSATLKTPVFFHKPEGAELYAAPIDRFQPVFKAMGGQHRLRLEGFLPNEAVRLLAYQFQGTVAKFYAWQDFKTDSSGRLIVETNFPEISQNTEMNFSAYGQETHSVHLERFTADGVRINRQFDMDLYCPGALAPHLAGATTIQPTAGAARLEIHYQPGFGSRVTALVTPDAQMRVFDYPKCVDHAFWWKVSLSKPILFGWVAESFLGKYLVEPVHN